MRKLRSGFRLPTYHTCTPTGDVLDVLLRQYRNIVGPDVKQLKKNEPTKQKRRVFLIITDGDPSKSFRRPSRVL